MRAEQDSSRPNVTLSKTKLVTGDRQGQAMRKQLRPYMSTSPNQTEPAGWVPLGNRVTGVGRSAGVLKCSALTEGPSKQAAM